MEKGKDLADNNVSDNRPQGGGPREIALERASLRDVDELLRLYFTVYGNSYPISLGTDRQVMSSVISGGNDIWLIARDKVQGRIAGSAVVEIDAREKIGKLVAVVSHPDYRKSGIATMIVKSVTEEALAETALNSVYTTTRTVSMGPQLMCLNAGYVPLGIFPNSHKLTQYETVTLMTRYREGILEKRHPLDGIPPKIAALWEASNGHVSPAYMPTILPADSFDAPGEPVEFELIEAPAFVSRRFGEFRNKHDYFYPFHLPNALLISTDGTIEIFAFLSRQDRYCTLISLNIPFKMLRGRMDSLLELLKDHKAEYIETLLPVSDHESISAMLDIDFLPSAIYPAMREKESKLCDYIVMSRTMVPLDLRGMQIASAFKPYIDQYVELWKQMHIDTLQVFSEHR